MLLLAVMPYHVVVTRQVLLDGPMVFFATLRSAPGRRYCAARRPVAVAAGGRAWAWPSSPRRPRSSSSGAVYAFFMLTPYPVQVRARCVAAALAGHGLVAWPSRWPSRLAGASTAAADYLAWQLIRGPNHALPFYLTTVPARDRPGGRRGAAGRAGRCAGRNLDWREWLLVPGSPCPIVSSRLAGQGLPVPAADRRPRSPSSPRGR